MRRIMVPMLEEQQKALDKRLQDWNMGQQNVVLRQEAVIEKLESLHHLAAPPAPPPEPAMGLPIGMESFVQAAAHGAGPRKSIRKSVPGAPRPPPPPESKTIEELTTEEDPPELIPGEDGASVPVDTSMGVESYASLPGAANEDRLSRSSGLSRNISGSAPTASSDDEARDQENSSCEPPVFVRKLSSTARKMQKGKSSRSLASKLSEVECKFGREYMQKGSLFSSSFEREESLTKISMSSRLKRFVGFRQACKRVVESSGFDAVCAFFILMNTILIGVEAEVLTVRATPHPVVHSMQFIIIVWFGLELLFRMFSLGLRDFFLGEERRWNWFDFALVMLAYLDYGAEKLALEGYATMARIMRVLRVVRILRSLRIIRVLRYVREFRKMVFAIQGSMQTLLWALFLLFFLLYGFAVCFTTAVAEHLRIVGHEGERASDLTASYGTLLRSFYSLYLAMSMGRGWGELVDILLPVGSVFVGLFILFITITVFGVLNVVTSVFVESAMQTAQHYKELMVQDKRHDMETLVGHMRQVFLQIDLDKSGTISLQEFESFLENPELRMYVEALGINTADARALFRLLDKDASGRIDIEEFCQGCARVKGAAQGFDIHCILYEVQRQSTKWADFMTYVESQFHVVETLATHLVGVLDPEEGDAAEVVLHLSGSFKDSSDPTPDMSNEELLSELKLLRSQDNHNSSIFGSSSSSSSSDDEAPPRAPSPAFGRLRRAAGSLELGKDIELPVEEAKTKSPAAARRLDDTS